MQCVPALPPFEGNRQRTSLLGAKVKLGKSRTNDGAIQSYFPRPSRPKHVDSCESAYSRRAGRRTLHLLTTVVKVAAIVKPKFGMLINELTVYELKRIITPVIQLQSMSRVCSEIGEVLGIPKANRKNVPSPQRSSRRRSDFGGAAIRSGMGT